MENYSLPQRTRPRPPVHQGMPHAQIGIRPLPDVHQELFRRCFLLPDVRNEPTVISVPGARALWLDENLPLAHPELIARGREFAHIHPDGSLHVGLSPARAQESIDAGWAEPHPIAQYMGVPGMVMLYTPQDTEELDVIFQLVVDSYNYVTGRTIDPTQIGGNTTHVHPNS